MTLLFFFLHSLLITLSQAQTLNVWNISSQNAGGLSSTCVSVLNQALSCSPDVRDIQSSRFETDTTLSTLCTANCTSSWSTYIRRVQGACGTSMYKSWTGYQYSPMFKIEGVYEQYQSLCLTNSAGKFCNAVIRDILKINPDNQAPSSGASAPAATATCGECFFSSMVQAVQQPLSSAPEYASALSALQKSCKTTVAATTPSKTTYSIPPTSTATKGCQGSSYTVKSGDTCQSIALAQGISTTNLLIANNLPAFCRNFSSAGTSLCIPTAGKCSPYSLKAGDTCQKVAAAVKASFAQIVAWNPEVGTLCGNIGRLTNKTAVLCASNPGGAWVNPFTQTSTTKRPTPVFFTNGTAVSALSTAPARQTMYPNSGYVTPYANNTRLDCATYVNPPVLVNGTSRTYSYSCANVARGYGVSVSDLLSWNPSINTTGGVFDPCELPSTFQYCAQVIPKISPGITTNCNLTDIASPGSTCKSFAIRNNITTAAVVAWNPNVGSNCSNYAMGTTYCKAVSHFRSSDTVSNCAYWAMANASTPSICTQMVNQYKLTMPRFVAWNPSVLSDCSGAVKGFDYCVGTPTVHPGFP